MPPQDSNLAQHLSPHLYDQLQVYQRHHGHTTLTDALNEALNHYFSVIAAQSSETAAISKPIAALEKRLDVLTRELLLLRQDVPQRYDSLREQLAAVRLSHSGLLQNLRQRVEALEQTLDPADSAVLPLNSEPTSPRAGETSS